MELARAFVTIRGDSSGLGGDLQNVRTEVESSMKSIAAGAAALLAPFAAFGRGVIRDGLAMAKSYEQTTVEMETMLGSATETQATLERLTKFAVETPFEMPQLLNSVRGLVTFGERGDELFNTLKVLGDASGGSAEKFGLLSLVFNQVRGVGKLLTQDFRQLSTRGIISLQDIAKYYKVSTAAAQSMMSAGKISFNDFKKILTGLTEEGGRFANGMIRQSTTLEGLTSTFNDAINITKRMIAEPLVPYMKAIYSAGIAASNAMSNFVKNGGEGVAMAFAGSVAFGALGAAIFGATFAARLFGITLKKALIGSGVGLLILGLGAISGWLVSVLKPIERLTKSWESVTSGIFGTKKAMSDLSLAWDNVKKAALIMFDAVMTVAAPFFNMIGIGFSTTAEMAQNSFNLMILKAAEWALDTSEWAIAIATHLGELWNSFPAVAGLAFSMVVDIMENAGSQMFAAISNPLADIIENFHIFVGEVKIAGEQVMDLLSGIASGTVVHTMDETIMRIREEAIKAGKAATTFRGAPAAESLTDWSFGTRLKMEEIDVIRSIQETKDELRKNRRKKPSKEALVGLFGGGAMYDPALDINKSKTPEAEGAGGPMSKAGIFQIEELGKNMQKNMLDDKKNPAHQTNALLEDGKKLQEKHLKVAEQMAAKIGGGMEE